MLYLQGSATRFPSWLLIALFGVGAGIVLFTLVPRRGRVAPAFWALLFVGLGVLPLLSGPIGVSTALNYSETVDFCASCHTPMQPYVDDMRDPRSESLAAVHYKKRYIPRNQCYICHTDSGFVGTVHAKLDGVVDLYKYYSATFRTPIVMRRAYANTYCLKCHRNSAKYDAVKDHNRNQAALFSGKRPCMDCHAEAAPAHATASSATSESERGEQ